MSKLSKRERPLWILIMFQSKYTLLKIRVMNKTTSLNWVSMRFRSQIPAMMLLKSQKKVKQMEKDQAKLIIWALLIRIAIWLIENLIIKRWQKRSRGRMMKVQMKMIISNMVRRNKMRSHIHIKLKILNHL